MAKYESFFLISSHLFSMHKIIIMFSRIFTNGLDHPTRHTHYDGMVVPEFLRTLVFARPRGDDQFADCTFSPSLDMSR